MVGVAPTEGSGRRLPQWMLGISAVTDQLEKSDKTQLNKKQNEEGHLSQACHSATTKYNGKDCLLNEKENLLESSPVLATCKTKTRKPKAKKVADSDTSISEKVLKKRKVLESASRKRKKTKDFGIKIDKEPEIQPMSKDDDVELTVEDLMAIAEEYVGANVNMKKQEKAAKRNNEPRSRPPTTLSSRNEFEGCNDAHICNQKSAADDFSVSCNQTSATHDVITSYKSNTSSTAPNVVTAGGTGDFAHEMLDLFLGPLLKKPIEEKKTDFVTGDTAFSQEFAKVGIRSESRIIREEGAPLVKKKSSLKDKVATFLSD